MVKMIPMSPQFLHVGCESSACQRRVSSEYQSSPTRVWRLSPRLWFFWLYSGQVVCKAFGNSGPLSDTSGGLYITATKIGEMRLLHKSQKRNSIFFGLPFYIPLLLSRSSSTRSPSRDFVSPNRWHEELSNRDCLNSPMCFLSEVAFMKHALILRAVFCPLTATMTSVLHTKS